MRLPGVFAYRPCVPWNGDSTEGRPCNCQSAGMAPAEMAPSGIADQPDSMLGARSPALTLMSRPTRILLNRANACERHNAMKTGGSGGICECAGSGLGFADPPHLFAVSWSGDVLPLS